MGLPGAGGDAAGCSAGCAGADHIYGYASSKEDALLRLQYDLYYIKHWSPWLDFVMDMLALRGRA